MHQCRLRTQPQRNAGVCLPSQNPALRSVDDGFARLHRKELHIQPPVEYVFTRSPGRRRELRRCTDPPPRNHLVTAGLTWHACDMPQEELSLIPLICITALFQIVFFSMRVWSIRSRQHNRGLDDIAITVAFVGTPSTVMIAESRAQLAHINECSAY